MDIKIVEVIPPSDKQKAAGIHGTVNLEIVAKDGITLARLSGLTIRKTKDGSKSFLSPPSYKAPGKDGKEDKFYPHFAVFPSNGEASHDANQHKLNDSLTNEVMRILAAGGQRRDKQAAPASASAAASTTSGPAKKNPWD